MPRTRHRTVDVFGADDQCARRGDGAKVRRDARHGDGRQTGRRLHARNRQGPRRIARRGRDRPVAHRARLLRALRPLAFRRRRVDRQGHEVRTRRRAGGLSRRDAELADDDLRARHFGAAVASDAPLQDARLRASGDRAAAQHHAGAAHQAPYDRRGADPRARTHVEAGGPCR